jgi:hypothetical protein
MNYLVHLCTDNGSPVFGGIVGTFKVENVESTKGAKAEAVRRLLSKGWSVAGEGEYRTFVRHPAYGRHYLSIAQCWAQA